MDHNGTLRTLQYRAAFYELFKIYNITVFFNLCKCVLAYRENGSVNLVEASPDQISVVFGPATNSMRLVHKQDCQTRLFSETTQQ